MLKIKNFSKQKVIITDGKNDYLLLAKDDNEFDYFILESILNYSPSQVLKEDLTINENTSD